MSDDTTDDTNVVKFRPRPDGPPVPPPPLPPEPQPWTPDAGPADEQDGGLPSLLGTPELSPPFHLTLPDAPAPELESGGDEDGGLRLPAPADPDKPTARETVALAMALVTALGVAAAQGMWHRARHRQALADQARAGADRAKWSRSAMGGRGAGGSGTGGGSKGSLLRSPGHSSRREGPGGGKRPGGAGRPRSGPKGGSPWGAGPSDGKSGKAPKAGRHGKRKGRGGKWAATDRDIPLRRKRHDKDRSPKPWPGDAKTKTPGGKRPGKDVAGRNKKAGDVAKGSTGRCHPGSSRRGRHGGPDLAGGGKHRKRQGRSRGRRRGGEWAWTAPDSPEPPRRRRRRIGEDGGDRKDSRRARRFWWRTRRRRADHGWSDTPGGSGDGQGRTPPGFEWMRPPPAADEPWVRVERVDEPGRSSGPDQPDPRDAPELAGVRHELPAGVPTPNAAPSPAPDASPGGGSVPAPTSALEPLEGAGHVSTPVKSTQYADADLTIYDVIDADADMAEEITDGVVEARRTADGCERLMTRLEALHAKIVELRVPGSLEGMVLRLMDKTATVRAHALAIADALPAAAEAISVAGSNAEARYRHPADVTRDMGHTRPAERDYHNE